MTCSSCDRAQAQLDQLRSGVLGIAGELNAEADRAGALLVSGVGESRAASVYYLRRVADRLRSLLEQVQRNGAAQ